MVQSGDKVYDLNEAREKIRRYCAYQERSQRQVRNRLRKMGLIDEAIDLLISECIEDNFLNEERFARAFARGKHRMKGWGRNRIERELRQHDVTPYCIGKAMEEIDATDYTSTLNELAAKKWAENTGINRFARGKKVAGFLLRKGYESEAVWTLVHNMINSASEPPE